MIWQDFRAKKYSVWLTEEEQTHQLDVELKDFWLILLILMERLDIFVVSTGAKVQINMVSKPRKEEAVLKSQVMMMRIGLSCYQI